MYKGFNLRRVPNICIAQRFSYIVLIIAERRLYWAFLHRFISPGEGDWQIRTKNFYRWSKSRVVCSL